MATLQEIANEATWAAGTDVLEDTKNRVGAVLTRGRRFVFNIDLDGVLSALLLQHYLDWRPAGVCACGGRPNDSVWLHEDTAVLPEDLTFVDMWVAPSSITVIDQHVVAISPEHADQLRALPNKLNPNLLWPCIAASKPPTRYREYKWKYPFGVVHFIIAALESAGVEIEIENRPLNEQISVFDLMLRADDAQRSTARKYRSNAIGWWVYLSELGGKTTKALADYCVSISDSDSEVRQAAVEEWISAAGAHIRWLSKDGNFSRHFRDSGWDEPSRQIVRQMADALGLDTVCPAHGLLSRVGLAGNRGPSFNATYVQTELNEPRLFSYAITALYGPGAATGFSRSHL
jgi:hypothetical protein